MTDLEKFRALMESFHLQLEQLPTDGPRRQPGDTGRTILLLRNARYDLGQDYPPVFVFNEDGSFHQAGSIV